VVNVSPTDAETDGGTPDPADTTDVFSGRAEVAEESLADRARRVFDLYVYAPVSVAMEDWRTRIGSLILLYFLAQGFIGPLLVKKPQVLRHETSLEPFHEGWVSLSPTSIAGLTLPLPEFVAPLGTQDTGQSIFGLIVYGTIPMFQMIFAGAVFSIVLAVLIGTIGGYKGGWIDGVLMTITDVVLTRPALALIIVLAAIYPPRNPYIVGLILGIDNWPGLARTIRSQVLSIREESFVEAHRTMGMPLGYIIRRDITAPLMPYISISFANSSRRIIFESVGLYFLGILPFSTQNWGVIMNLAYKRTNLTNVEDLYWLFIPMITITVFTLGLILMAQGLDRVFNVRLRARHAKTVEDEGVAEET
jgi:peptide/nickel transport system permease protein